MKKFKVINTIKRIMLVISCIAFFLAAISIESASIAMLIILSFLAISTIAIAAFLERIIVLYHRNVKYRPIFTFNDIVIKNEVIEKYHNWRKTYHAPDTEDSFNYFYNKYVA